MTTIVALLVVYALMLLEWRRSLGNERALRAHGALEPDGDVHATMAWVYPATFAAMAIEGLVAGPPRAAVALGGGAVILMAKLLKIWAITSLGPRWTFRVLVVRGAPLVTRGPYALLRHPNYVAVLGEIVGFALLVGAPVSGVASLLGFGVLLARRIAVEERAIGLRHPPCT